MEFNEHYLAEKQERFIVNGISKQIQDDQYKLLEMLVSNCACPNMQCVEIGSWTGNSAVLIGTIIKRVLGKLYSVDWYQGSKDGAEHLRDTANKINIRNIFIENMAFFGLTDTVEQLPITSEEASKRFKDESLDCVFVDGDHRKEAVKQDSRLWYPKLKKGKLLIGHDYKHTGVQEAIDELFPMAEKMKELWWIKKT